MDQAQALDAALRQLGVMCLNLAGAMERIAQLEAENGALRAQVETTEVVKP